jgi:hypothetical protein
MNLKTNTHPIYQLVTGGSLHSLFDWRSQHLIIKERLGLSDEECVEQIHKNPYLQYFCGLKELTAETPFHPTMSAHFRKRFPVDVIVQRVAQITKKNDSDGSQ